MQKNLLMTSGRAFKSYLELLLGGFLLLYLLLPTQNDTLDAWAYAAEIKHGSELFHPHHLLFNAAHYLIIQALPFSISVLAWLKAANAIITYGSLKMLVKILSRMLFTDKQILAWTLVVGSSFAVMRFATEGETYMIPVFFSLAGSFFFLRFFENRQTLPLIYAGVFCAIACLFHQIQVGWYIGLATGALFLDRKKGGWMILPALLVPVMYVLIWQGTGSEESLFEFVNRDFYRGTAEFSIGVNNFLLTGINLIRSFIQIHGIILFYLKQAPWTYASIIGICILLIWTIRKGLPIKRAERTSEFSLFSFIHLGIFLLQLGFAFLSTGNAEFMLMLPFLIPIWVPGFLSLRTNILLGVGGIFLLWNINFGLLPRSLHNYCADEKLVSFIKEHPTDYYLLKDKNLIANQLYYWEGEAFETPLNLISINYLGEEEWKGLLEKASREHKQIYTDVPEKPQLLSRASLLSDVKIPLEECELKPVLAITAYLGTYHIFLLNDCESIPESD